MIAEVRLWGRTIGAATMEAGRQHAAFQYDAAFAESGIQVSPLCMPLSNRVYEFPELSGDSFHGLNGLLADSLPDRFGNALIDAWLAREGRKPDTFNAVERLCYVGTRGMGALEFAPGLGPRPQPATHIEVDALVALASDVMATRSALDASFADTERKRALNDLLRVGTSAGGARAKAVIAWNRASNEVRSGQIVAGDGFEYWLLKFDGVRGNGDHGLVDPQGFGVIEYAYALMARAAGITMSECRLLEEQGRKHFMTRRFDRTAAGAKLHMHSLAGMAQLDYNRAGAYGYEQALQVIRRLQLPMTAVEEQFRRMAFNIVARNQDDHVKNIAFLMNRKGQWSLAPAFDVSYSYNPSGAWTSTHQMTMHGKRDAFTMPDFRAAAGAASMKRGRAESIVQDVCAAVKRWPEFARKAGVPKETSRSIQSAHRLEFADG